MHLQHGGSSLRLVGQCELSIKLCLQKAQETSLIVREGSARLKEARGVISDELPSKTISLTISGHKSGKFKYRTEVAVVLLDEVSQNTYGLLFGLGILHVENLLNMSRTRTRLSSRYPADVHLMLRFTKLALLGHSFVYTRS